MQIHANMHKWNFNHTLYDEMRICNVTLCRLEYLKSHSYHRCKGWDWIDRRNINSPIWNYRAKFKSKLVPDGAGASAIILIKTTWSRMLNNITKDMECGDLGPQYHLSGENVTKSHETAGRMRFCDIFTTKGILWAQITARSIFCIYIVLQNAF